MQNPISGEELSEVLESKLKANPSTSLDEYVGLRLQQVGHQMAYKIVLGELFPWQSRFSPWVHPKMYFRIVNAGATDEQVLTLSSQGYLAYEAYLYLLVTCGSIEGLTPESAWKLVQKYVDDEEELTELHTLAYRHMRTVEFQKNRARSKATA